MATTTKPKAPKIKPQHPTKVPFEEWRKKFESSIFGGTRAARVLGKYKAYYATTFAAQECTNDQELRTEMLRNIYAETGVRPLDKWFRDEAVAVRKQLGNIASALDEFIKRMRTRKYSFIPSADGTNFVNPVMLVQAFEDASQKARDILEELKPGREIDVIYACLPFLIEVETVRPKRIMSQRDACVLAKVALQAHGYSYDAVKILDDVNDDGKPIGTIRYRVKTAMIDFWASASHRKTEK